MATKYNQRRYSTPTFLKEHITCILICPLDLCSTLMHWLIPSEINFFELKSESNKENHKNQSAASVPIRQLLEWKDPKSRLIFVLVFYDQWKNICCWFLWPKEYLSLVFLGNFSWNIKSGYVTLRDFTPDFQKYYTDISAISVTLPYLQLCTSQYGGAKQHKH